MRLWRVLDALGNRAGRVMSTVLWQEGVFGAEEKEQAQWFAKAWLVLGRGLEDHRKSPRFVEIVKVLRSHFLGEESPFTSQMRNYNAFHPHAKRWLLF